MVSLYLHVHFLRFCARRMLGEGVTNLLETELHRHTSRRFKERAHVLIVLALRPREKRVDVDEPSALENAVLTVSISQDFSALSGTELDISVAKPLSRRADRVHSP